MTVLWFTSKDPESIIDLWLDVCEMFADHVLAKVPRAGQLAEEINRRSHGHPLIQDAFAIWEDNKKFMFRGHGACKSVSEETSGEDMS